MTVRKLLLLNKNEKIEKLEVKGVGI